MNLTTLNNMSDADMGISHLRLSLKPSIDQFGDLGVHGRLTLRKRVFKARLNEQQKLTNFGQCLVISLPYVASNFDGNLLPLQLAVSSMMPAIWNGSETDGSAHRRCTRLAVVTGAGQG
jgi:hypothetical protein